MSANYKGLFENWELAVSRKLVRQFRSRWASLGRDEFDELMQECLVHWLSVRSQFDPALDTNRSAFIARVVRNKLTDLVRERDAEKRKASFISISLDQPLGNQEDSPTLLDVVNESQVQQGEQLARTLRDDAEVDIQRAMKLLTPFQKQVCTLLWEGLSVQEASRELGVVRTTLYDELKRIRKIFSDLGLQHYINH
jgi:RNA polymerase sigma factor (sigma-70 family)